MKNLKKVLALVLAVAMIMGLAITSSAAKFSDASTVENTEAVDVVSALGIINGFTDGTFRGTENVTRAQMAKMVCFVLNSGDDVGAYYGSINAYTDCASHWAKGYIAYCDKMGIVAGVGNGKFNPDGTVTGAQAAKMLLCALGYDQKIEGYTGSSWAQNVVADAKDAGLLDNMGKIDMTAPLSRDNAALMILNALQATMVEYDNSGTSITVGGTTISTGASKATKVEKSDSDKDYSNIDDTKDGDKYYAELGEEYFDKLTKTSKSDDFGRPGHKWKFDGNTIGTYGDTADKTQVVDQARTLSYVLTDGDYMDYDKVTYTSSNTQVYPAVFVNGDSTTFSASTNVSLVAGDAVEAFENDDGEVTTVVITRYSAAKIDEVDTTLSSTYTKKGSSVSITLKNVSDDFANPLVNGNTYYDANDDYDATVSGGVKVLAGYKADTYKEDAVLAVAANKYGKILDSYVATAADGTVSSYNSGDTAYISLGGNKLYLNGAAKTVAASNGFDYKDTTYTAYTDKNGYVIGYDSESTTKLEDVYYVTGVVQDKSGTYSTATYYAQAVLLKDGSVSTIKLEPKSYYDMGGVVGSVNTLNGNAGLYTFTDSDGSKTTSATLPTGDNAPAAPKSGNGKFWGESYTGDSTYTVYGVGAISDNLTKSDGSMTINGGSGHKVYLDSTTNYVKVEDTGDNIDVTTVTGGTSAKATNSGNATTAIAVCTKSGSSYDATYVVLISKDFAAASDSSDVLYISDVPESYTGDGWTTTVYFMDGTGKSDSVVIDQDTAPARGFYTFTVGDDGLYSIDSCDDNLASGTSALSADYDKETGYVMGAVATNVHDDKTMSANLFSTYKAVDVDFSSNVRVLDERTDAQKDASKYSGDILSLANLSSAVEKENLKINVYYDDSEVILVAVAEQPTANDASITTASPSDGKVTILSATAGEVAADNTCTYTVTYKVTDNTNAAATITFTAGSNCTAPSPATKTVSASTAVGTYTCTFTVTSVTGELSPSVSIA